MQTYKKQNQHAISRPAGKNPRANTPNIPNSGMLQALSSLPSKNVGISEAMNTRMEARFGVPLNGLRVYEDAGIKETGRLGYARGNEVHISNDLSSAMREDVLSHEIGHVVQQGMGLVRGSGMVQDAALESQASAGFMAAPETFSIPTSPAGAPVQSLDFDMEKDAAAEKKGFRGGVGRRVLNPLRFVKNKIAGLKHKAVGAHMSDTAKQLAAEDRAIPDNAGDAKKYESPKTPSKAAQVGGMYKETIAPAASLVGSIAGVGLGAVNTAGGMVNTLGTMINGEGSSPVAAGFGSLEKLGEGVIGGTGVGTGFGAAGGAVAAAGSLVSAASNASKATANARGGNEADMVTSGLQTIADIGNAAKGITQAVGFAGAGAGSVAGSAASSIIPGLNVGIGAVQMGKGVIGAGTGKLTQHRMSQQIQALKDNEEGGNQAGFSEDQKRSLLRSMHMAREMGAINKEAGVWDMAAGALNVGGGALTLSGVGVLPGTIVSTAGTIVGAVGGMNKGQQIADMRERVVDQELDMKTQIEKLNVEMTVRGINNTLSTAEKERIILRRMGYWSGTKNEVFMNIAMNRSKMLTDMANNRPEGLVKQEGLGKDVHGEDKYDWGGNEEKREQYRQRKFARQTLKGMGLGKRKLEDGRSGYTQQGVGEKLGMESGVNIHQQLSASAGADPLKTLEKEKSKVSDKITKYEGKLAGNPREFRRRRHQKKLDKYTERRDRLEGKPRYQR